ncbi:MAG: PAS domain-containing protein [Xanthomonadales bacterium]|nr:PAS domain-containing protein [Xanthomonadales bacterium]
MRSTEKALLLREAKKIVTALGQTLAPLVEVVLNDLTQPDNAIIAIENNLSGRNIGDPATELGLARISDPDYPEVLLNYSNSLPDGRPVKSTSIGIKNSHDEYVAAICLNVDISMLKSTAGVLNQFVQTIQSEVKESLISPSLRAIETHLERFAIAYNTTPQALNSAQRREAIQLLSKTGLMDLKHAHAVAANVLGVARSTIYTYLPKKD